MTAIKPRVLITDDISGRAEEVFRARGIEVTVKTSLTPDELRACIAGFDGLAVRSSTKITADILHSARGRLKVIGRAGIGVSNIDMDAATQNGVVVMNTPLGNAVTTAEHTIAMMLALARQIAPANASTHAGKWERSRFTGQELCGKTLGLIGCGNIGTIVADRALGLKMKVIAHDPLLSPERAVQIGVEKAGLDDLLARADVITLHTPLTAQTRGMIDAEACTKMKKGVRLINCARGGLIVEDDLKAALDRGRVAGAALDVFEEEPARSSPLFGMDNVVCTPHLGASTVEAQENVALQIAEQMADFLLNGTVSNAINMPAVSAGDAPRLGPYMKLADQLGSFAGQISQDNVKEIKIDYEGEVSLLNMKPLTALILAGFLKPSMEGVNIVSAPARIKEMGVRLSETTRAKSEPYHTLVRVTVTTAGERNTLAGTLVADAPRITDINGMITEAELGRHMLYVINHDKPGLIGAVGTALGGSGINIANFNLGRIPGQTKAVALVSVDDPIPEKVISVIGKLAQVERALVLKF